MVIILLLAKSRVGIKKELELANQSLTKKDIETRDNVAYATTSRKNVYAAKVNADVSAIYAIAMDDI